MTILLMLVGLVLLTAGAELLVRGASRLALAWGISPLVVGLTVVAFGTSAPEMAVSVQATLQAQSGIALGNVVGSNIFNVLFILGIASVIAPLAVSAQLVRLDVPLMVIISFALWGLALDDRIGVFDASIMFIGLLVYTAFLIRASRKEVAATGASTGAEVERVSVPKDLALVVGGLVLLVVGSQWLVEGAVAIARSIGVSDLVIGLTLIAAGTSLPELATSILATLRGQRDIAVGNVVGSNIFNILGILGVSGLVGGGIEVPHAATAFDIPVMTAVAVACLPIFFSGEEISRWEGFLFLGYYAAYTVYLILAATQHDALDVYSRVMLGFAVPLTVLTLLVIAINGIRHRHRRRRRQ